MTGLKSIVVFGEQPAGGGNAISYQYSLLNSLFLWAIYKNHPTSHCPNYRSTPMGISADTIELKYYEILEYQEVVTNAAIHRMTLDTVGVQVINLELAVMLSLFLGCCTRVFILNSNPKQPR